MGVTIEEKAVYFFPDPNAISGELGYLGTADEGF